jgi:hypothetical protein
MWLTFPNTPQPILIESQLEPISEDNSASSVRGSTDQGAKPVAQGTLRDTPKVCIWSPTSVRIQDLCPPKKLPRLMRVLLNQFDFHLVYLSCSFRPLTDESCIKWARFRITLLPDSATGVQPIAFDLYPQQVVQEVKRQVKVTFSPLLKFQELEASAGTVEIGFEDIEQIPLISGTLGSGFDPIWSYEAGRKRGIEGDRRMYLLVKAPKGLARAQAHLELEADVLVRGTVIAAKLWRKQEQTADPLTVSLWG